MTRIHYEIPSTLHRRAKVAAAREGVTLKQYVIGALELATRTPREGKRTAGGSR